MKTLFEQCEQQYIKQPTCPAHRQQWVVLTSPDSKHNISIWQQVLHFYQPVTTKFEHSHKRLRWIMSSSRCPKLKLNSFVCSEQWLCQMAKHLYTWWCMTLILIYPFIPPSEFTNTRVLFCANDILTPRLR